MLTSPFWEFVDSQPVNSDLWQYHRDKLPPGFLETASRLAQEGHGGAHLMVSPYEINLPGEGASHCALANLLISLRLGSTNSAAASANILGTPQVAPARVNIQPTTSFHDILDRSVTTLGGEVFAWVMREGEDDFHFPNRRETVRTFLRRILVTDDEQIIPWIAAGICCLKDDRLKVVVVPIAYNPLPKKVNGLPRKRTYPEPRPRALQQGPR